MPERAKINRPITLEEIAVIRSTLERAPVGPEFSTLAAGLERLRVIDYCGCGCDSVYFVGYDPTGPPRKIADGIGDTPAGVAVGVIVWGTTEAVTGLEIYSLGAHGHDLKLPLPESVREGAA